MTDKPHFVYVLTGENGDRLYVGCTSNLPSRLGSHASIREWWPDVANVVSTRYPNEEAALAAERELIQGLRPIHNVTFTGRRTFGRSNPCRRCHRGSHHSCLGVNRDGDLCPCKVCVRSMAVVR